MTKKFLFRAIFGFFFFWNSSSFSLVKASPITYKLTPTDLSNPELRNFAEENDFLISSKKLYDEDFIFENEIHDESQSLFKNIEQSQSDSGTQLFNTANLDSNFDIAASNKEFKIGLDPSYLSSITEIDTTGFQSNIGSSKKNVFELEQPTFSSNFQNSNLNTIIPNEERIALTPQLDNNLFKVFYEEFGFYATVARKAYCFNRKTVNPVSGIFLNFEKFKVITYGADERNLTYELRKENSQMVDFPGVPGAKVHKGFYQKYLKWQGNVKVENLQKIMESSPNLETIRFNGYGLASVYAEFVAISLAKILGRSIKIELHSFGKPRIGNEAYAKYVSSLIESLRFTYKRDSIPRRPVDFKGEKYVHNGNEYWDNGVKDEFQVCEENSNAGSGVLKENQNCINKDKNENSEDHAGPYFGIAITDCTCQNDKADLLKRSSPQYPKKKAFTIDRANEILQLKAKALYANLAYCLPYNEIGSFVEDGTKINADVVTDRKSHVIVAYFKGPHLIKSEWKSRKSQLVPYHVQGMLTNPLVQVDKEWLGDVSTMMDALIKKINGLLKDKRFKKIVFCGHGVGGAYAAIAGLSFTIINLLRSSSPSSSSSSSSSPSSINSSYLPIDLSIYTFGEPRVGNTMFATMMNEFVKVTRVTRQNDYVPHFPPVKNGLSTMQHHEDEIWIGPADCDCGQDTAMFKDEVIWECGKYRRKSGRNLLTIQLFVKKKFWIPIRYWANENKECNTAQSITGSNVDLEHFGPYFGVIMKDCYIFENNLMSGTELFYSHMNI
ncbi:hypothetical protein G9A89_021781 [Geosiphon pyriformis]|nr:hypothetical protein G9A89_021781 [Geosiphon pyriformis]